MTFNLTAVRATLLENACNSLLIDPALQLLEPFLEKCMRGYDCVGRHQVTETEAARAIADITQSSVRRIAFVSMTEHADGATITRDMLGHSFQRWLGDVYGHETAYDLDGISKPLNKFVSKSVKRNLFPKILSITSNRLAPRVGYTALGSIKGTLAGYLEFTLCNEPNVILKHFRRMVTILPYMVPLAELNGSPGVWICLIA